jgi:hypothetical protein
MTHLIIIAERPDACSPASVQAWSAFLNSATPHIRRDRSAQTLLEGCFLLERSASSTTIGAILGCARRADIRYHVLEALSCKSADAKLIQIYDPEYQGC